MTPEERFRRIDSVLDRALQLDASAREALLEEVCQDDPTLRREIDALLEAHDRAGTFLASPALDAAARALAREQVSDLSGRSLGPYPLLALIGTGGMGEVYRAHDPRLGRDVAIKVLPPHLSENRDALARFEREAKAVAALSHANILAIHDFGMDDGIAYAVMELLDGETLRARLARAPMSRRRVMSTALQIADGLAAAHARGIVHRDLKPENIFLASSGQTKILDFGLARIVNSPLAPSETKGSHLGAVTEPGTVMGTVGYMSPELVRGEDAGPASDIFAFGCVLYEMLSGHCPFERKSAADTLVAVLVEDPAPLGDVSDLPPALESLVLHCLEKRPQDRFQSASDMAFALRALGGTEGAAAAAATAGDAVRNRNQPGRRFLTAGVALGLMVGVIVALGGAWIAWRLAAPRLPSAETVRLSMPLLAESTLAPNDSPSGGSSIAISQDGRWIAYVARRKGQRWLALRSLDSGTDTILPGTEGALTPIFSPDAQWIAFFTETELRKVPRSGGTPTIVCQTPPVTRGAVWSDDGTIYFSPSFTSGIERVVAGSGEPTPITTVDLDAGESNHLLPEALPGARALLFTVWKGGDFGAASIWSLSIPTRERKLLLESATAPRYVSPGILVFARNGALFATRFDAERLTVAGEAVPVIDGVWTDRTTGTMHYAVARNGTLIYAPGGNTVERRRLVWVNRQGHVEPLPVEPSFYSNPRLSADGLRIAVEALNDLWMYDVNERKSSRVTFRGVNQHPAWTSDGRHLAFSSSQGVTSPTLFWTDVEAGGQAQPLDHDGGVQFPGSWTPDGTVLAFTADRSSPAEAFTGWDILLLRPGKTPSRSVLVRTPFKEDQPMFSPDGRALAYVSDDTGQLQVYVRSFPDNGRRVQVTANGGTEPVWSRRSNELFYRKGSQYFSIPVTTTANPIRVGRPTAMFEGDFAVGSLIPGFPSYDVAPDGRRFVMVMRADDTPQPVRLEVILGWVQDLERRLGSVNAR